MTQILIDNRKFNAEEGETILEVARRNQIDIPTLCHHEALEAVGACRLCTVEITGEDWNGSTKLVSACLYPVEEGLIVQTRSEGVLRLRQTVLDLLMARCPESTVIRDLATQHGQVTEYQQFTDGSKCIMCYLCVRACAKLGCHAISAVNRGTLKEVAPPFHEHAESCVGCGTCATICPTGHIEMVDTAETRTIWKREFEFVTCKVCGEPLITKAYRDYALENRRLPNDYYTVCSACKKSELSGHFARLSL